MNIKTINDYLIIRELSQPKTVGKIVVASKDELTFRKGVVIFGADLVEKVVIYPTKSAIELGLGYDNNIKVVNLKEVVGYEEPS